MALSQEQKAALEVNAAIVLNDPTTHMDDNEGTSQ